MRFLAGRVINAVLVVCGVTILTFVILRVVPGDPARLMVPPGSSEDVVENIRVELGTDKPLLTQFVDFARDTLRGDLGNSFRKDESVVALIAQTFPNTLVLTLTSVLTALAVAVPLGVQAARRPGGVIDRIALAVSVALQSMPSFWLGVLLVYAFAVRNRVFPAIGMDGLGSLVLPTITLATGLMAVLTRTIRESMLSAFESDYVRAAIAKGLSARRITWIHAAKNASIPTITVLGIQIGFVLGGTFVVELIFNWPGTGLLALQAIQQRDFPVVQGVVMVVAISFVLVNLLVDVMYAVLDPRVRVGNRNGSR